ncbi:MAG: acetyl-CoA acetyltransferase [Anaerolineales bacterium]|nr:acetyl-CoA acetyltransferase [Chloroflexota bacterium]MBL7162540.1 acetyl-CoA acetyltransferase [Anaerolineales bacterium]
MRDVAILGVGMIPFGRRDEESLMDMLAHASLNALDDAGMGDKSVDAVYVANMGAGIIQHQTAIASSLVDRLSLLPAAADAVENGPASGGSAVKNGVLAVASGYYDYVLVVGGEKMREVTGWRATDFVSTMTHPEAEYPYGVTLPGMAGMFTRLYMEKYNVTREQIVAVAIKNQEIGILNPYAHIEMVITKEGIMDSPHSVVNNPVGADPLHLYDMCPVSDGAAAVVLCSLEMAQKLGKPKKPLVRVAGFGQATDTHTLQERDDPTDLKAVTLAAKQALDTAKLKPGDIDVAELHDAFTILEIAESEHVGFFKKGEGGKAALAGKTKLGGEMPINVSGGLKARGHPVGATGVAQVVDITWQLRHELDKNRQVKNAKNGMTVNFGGFGNNVLSFVLQRVEQ